MAILICGGAGYIGSHVNKLFAQNGYATVVYDNLSRGNREAVKWGSFIKADLADTDTLDKVFEETNIEAVVHLAAYAYVGESVTEPAKYYINNISNTLNLLEAMRRHNCDKIIFSSTCATYGIPEILPITEDMPQNPINPYGASKLMVERIFKDYARAYGLKYVVFRYFNAAGTDPDSEIGENHDPETHLIPLILEAASGKRPDIKVFGTDYPTPDGSCIRDYIHVTDIAKAHMLALKYLNSGGKSDFFNLGNEREASVFEVIEAVKRVTGKDFAVTAEPRRDGDPPVLVGSPEKTMRILGWKPRYAGIDEMVKCAWEWHCKQECRGVYV